MTDTMVLGNGSSVFLARVFHVESLRGGMNRLLLRALPTDQFPTRIEVHFQYVQYLDTPMHYSDLRISDVTNEDQGNNTVATVLHRFPECRVFRLESNGQIVGKVVAASCAYGEDTAPLGAESMFPIMG